MNLLVIHCLHVVHLMLRKINFECYRGKDCIKNFCKDLKEHVLEIINYEKKRKDAINTWRKSIICYDKKYHKVRDHCHYTGKYRGAAHNNCNLRCKTPKEIPVVFDNGFTCDYCFIIKEPAKKTKKYKNSNDINSKNDNNKNNTKRKYNKSSEFKSSGLNDTIINTYLITLTLLLMHITKKNKFWFSVTVWWRMSMDFFWQETLTINFLRNYDLFPAPRQDVCMIMRNLPCVILILIK